MLYFPQISTGCLAQFPLAKQQAERTCINDTLDGRQLRASDLDAPTVRWVLKYTNLADAEKQAIEDLFVAAQGRLRSFVFTDPTANLLSRTDDLNAPQWARGPLMTAAANNADPFGGDSGWRLTNGSGAAESISQAVACPPMLRYCFSMYVRSAAANGVECILRLRNSAGQVENRVAAGPTWSRAFCSGVLPDADGPITFEAETPASAVVDVYGLQVDAQPSPSPYKQSIIGGVYPRTRFDGDSLQVRTDGPNSHAMTLRLISRVSR